ncbi:MAG: hypothetical protein AB7U85_07015 [Alphaproteobacteria bacterium]
MKKFFILGLPLLMISAQANASSILVNKDPDAYRILLSTEDGGKGALNVESEKVYQVCSECSVQIEPKEGDTAKDPLFVTEGQEIIIEGGILAVNEGAPTAFTKVNDQPAVAVDASAGTNEIPGGETVEDTATPAAETTEPAASSTPASK